MADIAELAIKVNTQDVTKGVRELGKLDDQAKKTSKGADMLGKAIGGLAAALTVGAFASWIKGSIDAADAASKAAASAGVTIEALTGLQFAADLSGVSSTDLATSLRVLNVNLSNAAAGSAKSSEAFARLGIQVKDSSGNLRAADKVLLDVADKFAQYENGAAKAALAQELFGRSGVQMIPLLNSGREGIEALTAQAERLGLVLDQETATAAEQFNDSLTIMQGAGRGVANQVMAEMLPSLNDLTGTMLELSTETGAMDVVADVLGGTLKSLATVAIAIGAAFKIAGQSIGAVAAAMVMAATGDFKGAWETIKAGATDYADTTGAALTRIQRLWDGSAAETAKSAAEVNKKLKTLEMPLDEATKKTKGLTDAQKAMAKAAEDLARAQQSNADVISNLAEELYQATLSADELIQRQNELRLNEFATPDQVAQVESLTVAITKLKAAEAARQAVEPVMQELQMGTSGSAELDALTLAQEEKRLILEKAHETEVLNEQAHAEALILLDQQTAARRKEILDKQTADQQASTLAAANSIISVTQAQVGQLQGLFEEGSAAGKAFFVATQALAAANAIIQGIQAGMAIRVAYATMAAMSGPAAPAVLAAGEVHANIATGLGFASAAAIAAQTVASFDGGGFTGYGARSGGIDGKGGFMAVMHPNETVIDHTKGQQMPGRGGGTITNNFILEGKPDRRTQSQLAIKAGQSQRQAQARFGQ